MTSNCSAAQDNAILFSSAAYDEYGRIPFGAILLASALKADHQVSSVILDLPIEGTQPATNITKVVEDVLARINQRTLFVGFSTMCDSMIRSLAIAKELKSANCKVPIVFGGPEASLCARRLLDTYKFIDCVLMGEAEGVLAYLVKYVKSGVPQRVDGLAYSSVCGGPSTSTDHSQNAYRLASLWMLRIYANLTTPYTREKSTIDIDQLK